MVIRPRTPLALLATVAAAAAVLAGCGSDDSASRTVTVTTPSLDESPDAGDTTTAVTPSAASADDDVQEINGHTALMRKYGKPGRDGGVTFNVLSVTPAPSIPTVFNTITAPKGAKLLQVKVVVRNDGKIKVDPFCGNTGMVLIDTQGRNFEFHSDSVSIDGNDICEGVQPGFKHTETIAFTIPNNSKVSSIAVWDNSEDSDYEGDTYVRFSAN